jgi:hypothetical protein
LTCQASDYGGEGKLSNAEAEREDVDEKHCGGVVLCVVGRLVWLDELSVVWWLRKGRLLRRERTTLSDFRGNTSHVVLREKKVKVNWKRQETYEDAKGSPHTATAKRDASNPANRRRQPPRLFLCESKVKATGFAPVPPWSSNVENYHPISEVIVTGVCGRSLFFLEFVASEDQLWLQNR